MPWKKFLTLFALALVAGTVPVLAYRLHHLFVTGLNPFLGYIFSGLLFLTGLVFLIRAYRFFKARWLAREIVSPSLLFMTGALSYLIAGLVSGSPGRRQTLDFHIHDTYFVIANIHAVIGSSLLLGMFAAFYYAWPKIIHRSLTNPMAYIHFWITFAGVYFFILPLRSDRLLDIDHFYSTMPRRYIDYSDGSSLVDFSGTVHFFAFAAVLVLIVQLIFLFNIFYSLLKGKRGVGETIGS